MLDREQAQLALKAHRANNDLQLMAHTMALDRVFIENPDLRPYFYEGEPIPDDEPLRGRVLSTAELIVDLVDTVASMLRHGQLDDEDIGPWGLALAWYGRSPAVRFVALNGEGVWRASTLALMALDGRETVHPIAEGPSSRGAATR